MAGFRSVGHINSITEFQRFWIQGTVLCSGTALKYYYLQHSVHQHVMLSFSALWALFEVISSDFTLRQFLLDAYNWRMETVGVPRALRPWQLPIPISTSPIAQGLKKLHW